MNEVKISNVLGNTREAEVRTVLEEVLNKYDLSDYTFTRKIQIDGNKVPPHSHPVLTLNTLYDDEITVLANYLHEQIHWFVDEKSKECEYAINEIRQLYPSVPSVYPEGARGEDSTYLHLIICLLEVKLLRKLIGNELVKEYLKGVHGYLWVYETVVADYDKLIDIIRNHDLELN